jgi:bifunctional non-homologous end joining protein LigD
MALPLSSPATPLPTAVAFQFATSSREPPIGDGWLYEVKHDGHRLAVIADGNGGVRLLSRNGFERSRHFGPGFADLARLGRQVVLDGEITAPDDRGVTHLDRKSARAGSSLERELTGRLLVIRQDRIRLR